MPVCKHCGKKGLFLKLNARGLCDDCAKLAAETESKTVVTIDPFATSRSETESIGHESEESLCKTIINELVNRGFNASDFRIEHRTLDYTSVFKGLSDFLRVKSTDNVQWVSILVTPQDIEKYKDSPLFERQVNKSEFHWKAYINTGSNLQQYYDIIENAARSATDVYGDNRELTEQEKPVVDYLASLLVECGANENDMYLYLLANELDLIYHSIAGSIRLKAYKKKGGYVLINERFKEQSKLADNGKLVFSEIEELNILKENYIPFLIEEANVTPHDMSHYIKYSSQ